MASIGFEWQFSREVMSLMAAESTRWSAITLPSKKVVYRWADRGVTIESDDGDAELITDPARSWTRLLGQLVFIGELLTVLTGTPPDLDKIGNRNLAAALTEGGLNQNLYASGGTKSRKRMASAVVDLPAGVTQTDTGHLELTAYKSHKVRCAEEPSGSARGLVCEVPADITTVNAVENNKDVKPDVVIKKGDELVVKRGGASVSGVAQCTMEIALADLPDAIGKFSKTAHKTALGWLRSADEDDDVPPSRNLVGFLTVLAYYLECFSQSTIASIKDGPKGGFNVLPRMNLKSVHDMLLDDFDRADLKATVEAFSSTELAREICPHGYKAGTGKITNDLTFGDWLASIRFGDAGTGVPNLNTDYAGTGPRGKDYDKLSPPKGYPAHFHPGRKYPWMTYAMGRENVDCTRMAFLIEFRDVQVFGERKNALTYEQFVEMAANAAAFAGMTDVPRPD
jgi:hypothetical protein